MVLFGSCCTRRTVSFLRSLFLSFLPRFSLFLSLSPPFLFSLHSFLFCYLLPFLCRVLNPAFSLLPTSLTSDTPLVSLPPFLSSSLPFFLSSFSLFFISIPLTFPFFHLLTLCFPFLVPRFSYALLFPFSERMATSEVEVNSLVDRRRKLKIRLDTLLTRIGKYDPEKLTEYHAWEVRGAVLFLLQSH